MPKRLRSPHADKAEIYLPIYKRSPSSSRSWQCLSTKDFLAEPRGDGTDPAEEARVLNIDLSEIEENQSFVDCGFQRYDTGQRSTQYLGSVSCIEDKVVINTPKEMN